MSDRPADVWEPLLSVADAAGGDWPERGRAACVELVALAANRKPSLHVRLLGDIRTIFARMGMARMSTEMLLHQLRADEDAPWCDLWGKGLNAKQLAEWLEPYGVAPRQWRDGEQRHRGYALEDLADPFGRYLPLVSEYPVHP